MGIEGRRSERDRNFYSDLNNDTTNEEHDHKCNFFDVGLHRSLQAGIT